MEFSETLEREEYLNKLIVSISKNNDFFAPLPKKGIPLFVVATALAIFAATFIYFDYYLFAFVPAIVVGLFYKIKYEKLKTDWNAVLTIVQYEASPIYLLPLNGKIKPLEGIYFEIVEIKQKTDEEIEAEIQKELEKEQGVEGGVGEIEIIEERPIISSDRETTLIDDSFNAKRLIQEVATVPFTRRYDALLNHCAFLWRIAAKRDVIPKPSRDVEKETETSVENNQDPFLGEVQDEIFQSALDESFSENK